MSARAVCPHCGKAIKLRDRSLLGKKGRCPGCNEVFVLREDTTEQPAPALPNPPPRPRSPAAAPPAKPPAARVPDPAPFSIEPLPAEPLPEFNFDLGEVPSTPRPATPSAATSRKPRSRRSHTTNWAIWGVIAISLIGGGLYLNSQTSPVPRSATTTTPVAAPSNPAPTNTLPVSSGPYSAEALTADPNLVAEFRPTHGEPISLKMLTGLNNIVIHTHPNWLWGTDPHAVELRASLTDEVVTWFGSHIQKLTHRSPEQIEELLIGISAVSKAEPPQISVVARLSVPEPHDDLAHEFAGEVVSAPGQPEVTRLGEFAFHIHGDDTIAIAPASAAADLAAAISQPADCVTDGIADLIPSTDRERVYTVMFNVDDILNYADQLFEPSVIPAISHVVEAFGRDAETISWSLHLDSALHSEIRVRPKGSHSGSRRISTASTLRDDYQKIMPAFIERDLVACVRQMRPAQRGAREIIGRFPAMVEAFRQATVLNTGPKFMTMTTVLPLKAAPNLALGTVLTWEESTRTRFDTSPPEIPIAASETNLPKTVMERLKTEFEIEFARKPLAEAFAYLGEETRVNFIIDGDALKMAGYTKNMPQTFSLGKAPGTKGIYTILTWPMQEKLCLVINDAKMEALITTHAAAEAQGLNVTPVESLK